MDLLDADHKAVEKLFRDFNALCDDGAAPAPKRRVVEADDRFDRREPGWTKVVIKPGMR